MSRIYKFYPDTIQFNMGHQTDYTYSATGAKLRVTDKTAIANVDVPFPSTVGQVLRTVPAASTTVTDYIDNCIYEDGILKTVLLPEGYWQGGRYHYYLKDHLGSNRVVLRDDGQILERNHYYPSGQRFGESIVLGGSVQPYRHTGHEMQAMHGLNWIDNGARMRTVYDGGSFMTVDPLCEKRPWESPYCYAGGNPMNRVDPTGMIWDDQKEADNLKKNIDKTITGLNKDIANAQADLKKEGLNEKEMNKLESKISEAHDRISNLNTSKADIDRLGADQNNIYALSSVGSGEHKVRQGNDGKVYIETSSDALSIHEITHVRQSLDAGGLKFLDGKLLNSGMMAPTKRRAEISSNMEIEAYQKQYSYNQSFPGSLYGQGLKGIDVHSVGSILNEEGNPVYDLINQYSAFLKSQQKILGK